MVEQEFYSHGTMELPNSQQVGYRSLVLGLFLSQRLSLNFIVVPKYNTLNIVFVINHHNLISN